MEMCHCHSVLVPRCSSELLEKLQVLINWLELLGNRYHPSIEVHACQSYGMARTLVDISGNRIEGAIYRTPYRTPSSTVPHEIYRTLMSGGSGMGVRIAPLVNMHAVISSNQFLANNETALFVKNAPWPQLAGLPANVSL